MPTSAVEPVREKDSFRVAEKFRAASEVLCRDGTAAAAPVPEKFRVRAGSGSVDEIPAFAVMAGRIEATENNCFER